MSRVEEPVVLPIGTEVSAKYRGAFCEAKVKSVIKNVQLKVSLKDSHTSLTVTDKDVKGNSLHTGSQVLVRHPETHQLVEGVVNSWKDHTMYTVVFDDGDENTLRRTQLCLKGEKHFVQSETLDQLPLTHPEHFGTPVVRVGKGQKRRNDCSDDDSSDEEMEMSPKKRVYRGRQMQDMVGKIVCMVVEERKRCTNMPVLVVLPSATELDLKTREHLLVRSFKDNRFHTVQRKDTNEFRRELAIKNEEKTLKSAYEKALAFMDNGELPLSWDKEELLGSDSEEEDVASDSSDDEPSEEKDRFVAQLYKFMDDRGTPINKAPTVGNRDLSLYKLFRVVQNLGGCNKVTNQLRWRTVYVKMNLPPTGNAANQIKAAYKKYLHAFEEFYKKLGNTMGTINRPNPNRNKPKTSRSIMSFRNKESPRSRDSPAKLATPSEEKMEFKVEKVKESETDEHCPPIKQPQRESHFEAIKTTSKTFDSKETARKTRIKVDKPGGKDLLQSVKRLTREDFVKLAKPLSTETKAEDSIKKEMNFTSKMEEKGKKVIKAEAPSGKKAFSSLKVISQEMADKKRRKTVKPVAEDQSKPRKSLRADASSSSEIKSKRLESKVSEESVKTTPAAQHALADEGKKRLYMKDKSKAMKIEEGTTTKASKKSEPGTAPIATIEEKNKRASKLDAEGKVKKWTGLTKEAPARYKRPAKVDTDKQPKKKEVPEKKKAKDVDTLPEKASDKKDDKLSEKTEPKRKRLLDTDGPFPIGSKLKVKYGKGVNQKIYEAKVIECTIENGRPVYLVHYAGWNNRYNEWIHSDRIICCLEIGDPSSILQKTPAILRLKKSPKIVKSFVKKTTKPTSSSSETLRASKASTTSFTTSSTPTTATKQRPTRSNSTEHSPIPGLPAKRRKRRLSGLTDQSSDVPSHGSESESESSTSASRETKSSSMDSDGRLVDHTEEISDSGLSDRSVVTSQVTTITPSKERVKTKAEVKIRSVLANTGSKHHTSLELEENVGDDLGPPTMDQPLSVEPKAASSDSSENMDESDHSGTDEAPRLEISVRSEDTCASADDSEGKDTKAASDEDLSEDVEEDGGDDMDDDDHDTDRKTHDVESEMEDDMSDSASIDRQVHTKQVKQNKETKRVSDYHKLSDEEEDDDDDDDVQAKETSGCTKETVDMVQNDKQSESGANTVYSSGDDVKEIDSEDGDGEGNMSDRGMSTVTPTSSFSGDATSISVSNADTAATSGLLMLATQSHPQSLDSSHTTDSYRLENLLQASMMVNATEDGRPGEDNNDGDEGDDEGGDDEEDEEEEQEDVGGVGGGDSDASDATHPRSTTMLDTSPPESPGGAADDDTSSAMPTVGLCSPPPQDDASSQGSEVGDRDDDLTSSASQSPAHHHDQDHDMSQDEPCDTPTHPSQATALTNKEPHSSESGNEQTAGMKLEDVAAEPVTQKKRKKRQKRSDRQKKSTAHMSDSDDDHTLHHHSPTKRANAYSHSLTQAELAQRLANRPPKFNFHLEEAEDLKGDKKIEFLTEKMQNIRSLYMSLKSEVSSIDRRRKRARKKEKDQTSASCNTSSNNPTDTTQLSTEGANSSSSKC